MMVSNRSKPYFRQDSRLPVTKDLLRFAQVFSQMIKVRKVFSLRKNTLYMHFHSLYEKCFTSSVLIWLDLLA